MDAKRFAPKPATRAPGDAQQITEVAPRSHAPAIDPLLSQRLLCVWAHPDDEAFGPVGTLRMAVEQGWQVSLVSATHGEQGQADPALLGPNETLAERRAAELRCAARVIGIQHLQIWHYPDGGLSAVPRAELVARIADELRRWQPRVVITFGPDGITGHPDHIAIGAATTEAFRAWRAATAPDARLYYITVRPGRAIRRLDEAAPAPRPPSAVLDVSRYAAIKRQALACHATQRADWQPLLADEDWLTVDRFARAEPPLAPDAAPETTILYA